MSHQHIISHGFCLEMRNIGNGCKTYTLSKQNQSILYNRNMFAFVIFLVFIFVIIGKVSNISMISISNSYSFMISILQIFIFYSSFPLAIVIFACFLTKKGLLTEFSNVFHNKIYYEFIYKYLSK